MKGFYEKDRIYRVWKYGKSYYKRFSISGALKPRCYNITRTESELKFNYPQITVSQHQNPIYYFY